MNDCAKRVIKKNCPLLGLSVIMNIYEDTYLPLLITESVGARVAIHPASVLPLLKDEGYEVAPKTSAVFGIKQVYLVKLEGVVVVVVEK